MQFPAVSLQQLHPACGIVDRELIARLKELGHRVKFTGLFSSPSSHLPDAFPTAQNQHRRNAPHQQSARWNRSLPSRARWTTDLPVEHVVGVSSDAHAKFHGATIAEDKVSFVPLSPVYIVQNPDLECTFVFTSWAYLASACTYDGDREKPGLKTGAVEALRRRVGKWPMKELVSKIYSVNYTEIRRS